MADHGNEICEYIQQSLASASAANNATDTAASIQTTNKSTTMEVEIKKLTATIASMATKINGKSNPNSNGENINPNSGASKGSQGRPFKKLRNMGAYCSSSWNQTRQRDLHLQKARAQERSYMVQQARAKCIGPTPNVSQWNNRSTPLGKVRRLPPTLRG